MPAAQFDPVAFGTAVGEQIRDAVAPLLKRIELLEQVPFKYDGPHETDKVYERGMFVTSDGSLWHANYKTASRPGDGPAWTLAVKRGKDGR
ncbi:carbohydrate-binding family V/XII protein [Pseudorhodoferax soli]|uniref:Carbohydrate binding protein n=1 Tax=Pseudorhodoferax soli TaxID=545864 RepID=A0A368XBD9_9BURK|nr:carbohydrate-binding family V/XII protein [Pseudorhodoferax soli]RCW65175.1 carbohydrate binding protein [Pseudorhodoferax soli]